MLFDVEDTELRNLGERLAATIIVNQAAVKCLVHNIPVTADNIVFLIGDFIDPTRPEFSGLIEAILKAIDEVVDDPRTALR